MTDEIREINRCQKLLDEIDNDLRRLRNGGKQSEPGWLWSYRIQVENVFHQRISFFLLAQSMLFAGFAAMVSSRTNDNTLAYTFAAFGIFLSCLWAVTTLRQRHSYEDVRWFQEEHFGVYRWIREFRDCPDPGRFTASNALIAIPFVTIAIWYFIVTTVFVRSPGLAAGITMAGVGAVSAYVLHRSVSNYRSARSLRRCLRPKGRKLGAAG